MPTAGKCQIFALIFALELWGEVWGTESAQFLTQNPTQNPKQTMCPHKTTNSSEHVPTQKHKHTDHVGYT